MPELLRLRQREYDELSARLLDRMADHFEGRAQDAAHGNGELQARLADALVNLEADASREVPPAKAQSLIALLRAIDDLTNRLSGEIAAEAAPG